MTEHHKAHSRYGGSKAERWLNCAASVGLCAQVPEQVSSPYAYEGTIAHKLGEEALAALANPTQYVGDVIQAGEDDAGLPVTEEMAGAVQVYYDAVLAELRKSKDAEYWVEAKFQLDIKGAKGEVFGSNDCLVYHPSTGRLVCFDYKHGAGVSVSPDDNAQLKFYVVGAVFSPQIAGRSVNEIDLVIVQPRSLSAEEYGAVRSWRMDMMDVLDFQGEIEAGIKEAKKAEAFFKDGKPYPAGSSDMYKVGGWCRFCPAAGVCPAKERQALDAAGLDFRSVVEITPDTLPDPKTLDTKQLAAIKRAVGIFIEWGSQVDELIDSLLRAGTDVPGWKLVEKIGRAKWIEDDAKIAAYLVAEGLDYDQIMPRKLVTITEAERQLKSDLDKDAFAKVKEQLRVGFTLKESSGLTTAPVSEKRPAVNAVASDFASVNSIAAE